MRPIKPRLIWAPDAVEGLSGRITPYALSDVAVVVSSADGSGGTWTGAMEALRRVWVPVLVRDDPGVPAGNRSLVGHGAAPLSLASISEAISPAELVALAARSGRKVAERTAPYEQAELFDDLTG